MNMKILYYLGKHLELDESTCVFKSHAFLLLQKHGIYMNFWCYSLTCVLIRWNDLRIGLGLGFKSNNTFFNPCNYTCNNLLHLIAASLFIIFISTCTIINFKLIVSKNKNK